MAKKNSLLKTKKEIEKTFQSSAMESLAVAAGALGGSMLFNIVREKVQNENIRRFGGAILAGGGIVLNVAAKNPMLKAASHGITSVGTLQAIQDLAPAEFSAKFGISSATVQAVDGIGIGNTDNIISNEELQRLAAEAEAEIMAELEQDREEVNGVKDFEEFEEVEELEGFEEEELKANDLI